MATTPASASLKYWPGSHSGQARQGVYNGQNYSGTMTFNFSSIGDLTNIDITNIKLSFHVGALGGAYNKYLYLRYVPSGASSVSVDKYSLSGCYDTDKSLTFSASTHSNGFNKLKNYIESISGTSNVVLGINNTGSSRGSGSGKSYDYDYMSITSATLELTYTYKKSTGTITSAQTGSNTVMKITKYDNSYIHKMTWKLNSVSKTYKLYQGTAITGTSTTSAVYATGISSAAVDDQYINTGTNNIYICTTAGNASTAKWKYLTNTGAFSTVWKFEHSAIPNSTKGTATVVIETLNSSGASLGSNTYSFEVKVPDNILPSIGSFAVTPVNSGASGTAEGWGLYIQNKTKATAKITNASAGTGATMSKYSITSVPDYGSGTSSSLTSRLLSASGSVMFTAKVTDSRGRTSTATATITVQAYAPPQFTATPKIFRCTNNGTQDDIEGTFARLTASYSYSSVNGKNSMTVRKVVLNNVTTNFDTVPSGTTYSEAVTIGAGLLAVDNNYSAVITLTDAVGSTTTYTLTVPSAAYIIHIRKGGKSLGIGMAAAANTSQLDIGWKTNIKSNDNNVVVQGINVGDTANANKTALYVTDSSYKSFGMLRALTYSDGSTGFQVGNRRDVNGSGIFCGLVYKVAPDGTRSYEVAGAAQLRDALGLGNTSGALPVANGGTGATAAGATAFSNLGLKSVTPNLTFSDGTAKYTFTKNGSNLAVNLISWKAVASSAPLCVGRTNGYYEYTFTHATNSSYNQTVTVELFYIER